MHMSTATAPQPMVVEWAPFRLKAGVTEEHLVEVSARLQDEFLRQQRGFVRRELLKGAQGEWVDLVYWTDEESAHAVMPAIAGSPACRAYFDVMIGADPADPSGGVAHYRRMRAYP
jgi:hypothetical protein